MQAPGGGGEPGWLGSATKLEFYCCSSYYVDCSQSPIFQWDCRDIERDIERYRASDFQMYRGCGRRGTRKNFLIIFLASSLTAPTYQVVLTHARWQPVTQSARSWQSYGKIGDCGQSSYYVTRPIKGDTLQNPNGIINNHLPLEYDVDYSRLLFIYYFI